MGGPPLWRSEFRNVLSLYFCRDILTLAEVSNAYRSASALLREEDVTADEVFSVVARSSASAYDAEYVALVERLAVPLVTSDRALLRAFPDRAVAPTAFAA